MPIATVLANFGSRLTVTSLNALLRSILLCMGLDHALIDFLLRTAAGAATVLAVIVFVGIGMPKRSVIVARRLHR